MEKQPKNNGRREDIIPVNHPEWTDDLTNQNIKMAFTRAGDVGALRHVLLHIFALWICCRTASALCSECCSAAQHAVVLQDESLYILPRFQQHCLIDCYAIYALPELP